MKCNIYFRFPLKILAQCFTSILLTVGKALIVAVRLNKVLQSEVYSLIQAGATMFTCMSARSESKKLLCYYYYFKLLIVFKRKTQKELLVIIH